jgi:hypothetical protein
MSNVLGDDEQYQIVALGRLGWSLRRIQQATGVRRETASGYLKAAGIEVRGRGRRPEIKTKTGHFGGGVHRLWCGKSGHFRDGVHRLRGCKTGHQGGGVRRLRFGPASGSCPQRERARASRIES